MIQKLETLLKKSQKDLLEFLVTESAHAQSAAVNTAKAIIALVTVAGSEDAARKAMKKAGVSDATVRNAMQLVWTYDAVVRPGHADEDWFDRLLYAHAVEVRRAIAKVGVKKCAESGLFKRTAKDNLVEFALLADTGLNRKEREERDERVTNAKLTEEVAAKKKGAAAPAATPATPATGPKAPANPKDVASLAVKHAGAATARSPVEEFDTLIGGIERFVEAYVPKADDVAIEKLRQRVETLVKKLNAAVAARAMAKKKTA